MSQIQTTTGALAPSADGATPNLRSGRLNDLIVSELHGKYYEQAARGNVYSAMLAATTGTVAAGNINAAAAGASTQFAVWNPANSKVNLSLGKFFMNVISGTPPTLLSHTLSPNGVPGAQVGVPGTNHLTGVAGGYGRVLASAAGVALTGAGVLPAPLRPSAFSLFAAAIAATSNIQAALEDIDGSIIIAPGMLWVPTWSGAGTTFLNAYGLTWEEVPV